jgi:NAD(P)-dependent dehydrogenase (short-subunit alcohol dehydrogenase family)
MVEQAVASTPHRNSHLKVASTHFPTPFISNTNASSLGLSESLAKEVSSFGIKVLILEPGAFRTNFLGTGVKKPAKELNPAYKGTVSEDMLKKLDDMDGKQRGDTRKAVSVSGDPLPNILCPIIPEYPTLKPYTPKWPNESLLPELPLEIF